MEQVRVCTGYRIDGKLHDLLPFGAEDTERCEPVYRDFPGWSESTVGVRDFDRLPANARSYLQYIEEICGVPVAMISTGADRDETIVRRHPFH